MIDLANIWSSVLWMVGFNLIATVVLMLLLTKYPKYLVHAFNRFMSLKLGLSTKRLNLSPHISVSYIERGKPTKDQTTVLLVHGFSSSKYAYLQFIANLPQKYHVISLDLPGHGDTTLKEKEECDILTFVDYLKQFTNKLGLSVRKFHILGSSLGGHLAGVYASLYPDDLLSVSLYCPAGIQFEKESMMIEEAERTGKFILLPQTDDEFREMIDFITHKEIKIPNVFISGSQQLRAEKYEFYKRFLETLVLPENVHKLEECLHKIHTPLLVVWGKEDKVLGVDCVEKIKEKLPIEAKKIVILDEVGHGIHLERPKKSVYIFIEFLNTLI